jgi:hypothetical protein
VNARCSPGRILGNHTENQARTSLLTRVRPPTWLTLETHVQYKQNPARCQFTTVPSRQARLLAPSPLRTVRETFVLTRLEHSTTPPYPNEDAVLFNYR